jgi:hypothetical protein
VIFDFYPSFVGFFTRFWYQLHFYPDFRVPTVNLVSNLDTNFIFGTPILRYQLRIYLNLVSIIGVSLPTSFWYLDLSKIRHQKLIRHQWYSDNKLCSVLVEDHYIQRCAHSTRLTTHSTHFTTIPPSLPPFHTAYHPFHTLYHQFHHPTYHPFHTLYTHSTTEWVVSVVEWW